MHEARKVLKVLERIAREFETTRMPDLARRFEMCNEELDMALVVNNSKLHVRYLQALDRMTL